VLPNSKCQAGIASHVSCTCRSGPVLERIGWQVLKLLRLELTEDWASFCHSSAKDWALVVAVFGSSAEHEVP
jgi:hypothetical protein